VVDCPGRQKYNCYATDFEGNFLTPGSKKNLWRSCQHICTLFFYLVHTSALTSLLKRKTDKYKHIINAVSLRHVSAFKGPTSGSMPDTRKQQGQQNQISIVKFNLVSSVTYYTLLSTLNFTSGNSLC
jgi:hypothetical protein